MIIPSCLISPPHSKTIPPHSRKTVGRVFVDIINYVRGLCLGNGGFLGGFLALLATEGCVGHGSGEEDG